MNTFAPKKNKRKNRSAVNGFIQTNHHYSRQSEGNHLFKTITRNGFQEMMNNSQEAKQLKAYHEIANNGFQNKQNSQRQTSDKKKNNTGLPDTLKSGIETLSGYSMDDVKVHYNSAKPAQLNAHAYAQGYDIHLASGQERHLPHEAWHVVQQKQGRVKPTMQMKNVAINDDESLEKEADVMGEKSLQLKKSQKIFSAFPVSDRSVSSKDSKIFQLCKNKKAQESWINRKENLQEAINSANEEIEKAESSLKNFYEAFIDVPANIRVKISTLAESTALKLDQQKSQIANFSYSVLKLSKAMGQKSPEIQTGIVEDNPSQEKSVFISGNKEKTNIFLEGYTKGQTLEQFYKNLVRPSHIKRKIVIYTKARKSIFKSHKSRKKIREKIKKERIEGIPIEQWIWNKERTFLTNDDKKYEREPFQAIIRSCIAESLHKKSKKDDDNKRMRSARAFKKQWKTQELQVPENKKDIHAESAILTAIKKLDKTLLAIGGTKVACTACQAFYKEHDLRNLLGDETSFAWLSESSLTQLGISSMEVEKYLLKIKEVLQTELNQLRYYNKSDGTIGAKNMTLEEPEDTDSEDEDAMWQTTMEDEDIEKEADEIMEEL